jgi:predicted GIY-YIG superfamily endonuclease
MSTLSTRALAARARATKRWYVYLTLCRGGAIYTGIARNVAVRYARHVAGSGARTEAQLGLKKTVAELDGL